MLLLSFISICSPVSISVGGKTSIGADPAYAQYKKYRYAYDTYGYLFLSEETGGGVKKGDVGEEGIGALGGSGGIGAEGARVQGDEGGVWREEIGIIGAMNKESIGRNINLLSQLQDYDTLISNFYSVHASTIAPKELFQIENLMGEKLNLEKDSSIPQILIYHTHSQETYADYGPGNLQATVVSVGDYLTELLQGKGWNVIHDKSTYDMKEGELDRNRAYTYALEGITRILQANPSIQVILDIHRDGVREGLHLVSEQNGKQTAQIMFFQGMSRTPDGPIEYLPNSYISQNLAFSFQMQLLAEDRYPGLTRKIYLKGLRYNLHLRPRSALVEVGAQTNTLKEARNAMEPLAELLDTVLQGK